MKKIKSGDIFTFSLSLGEKGFFQYIFQDEFYLGGHLIRCFDFRISKNNGVNIEQIVKSKILFHAYTRLTEGIKKGLWSWIGNIPIEKSFIPPFFRETPDVFS